MKLVEIIQDSLKYPFSDWKNLLIFGIFVFIADLKDIPLPNIHGNILVMNLSSAIGSLFLAGYIIWNVRCSLEGEAEIPKILDLIQIFIDGIKVVVVIIIYCIPVFLLWILGGGIYSSLSIVLVSVLYPFIIAPLLGISIAHMVNNDNKFGFAFKFFEVIEKIESIGWIKLLMWYLATVIIFVILKGVAILISGYISYIVGIILGLVLSTIFYTYLSRSLALIYKSEVIDQ